MDKNKMDYSNDIVKSTMKKARRKMTFRIVRVVAICFAMLIFFMNIPTLLHGFQVGRITDAQKMVMMALEYTTPNSIVGYSLGIDDPYSFNRDLKIYYRNYAGHNVAASEQEEMTISYQLLTGKIKMAEPFSGRFLHQDRYDNLEDKYKKLLLENTNQAIRALEKNRESTVTLMNVSFKKSRSIEEVMKLAEGLDIELNWYAIETGYEGKEPPSYMGMPAQQYYSFGIPAKIFRPENIFNPDEINEIFVMKQVGLATIDLKWMRDHKDLLSNDKLWFLNGDIEKYLTENGVKCYGVQVNGPTDQVLEFTKRVDYLHLNMEEMSIWFW